MPLAIRPSSQIFNEQYAKSMSKLVRAVTGIDYAIDSGEPSPKELKLLDDIDKLIDQGDDKRKKI